MNRLFKTLYTIPCIYHTKYGIQIVEKGFGLKEVKKEIKKRETKK